MLEFLINSMDFSGILTLFAIIIALLGYKKTLDDKFDQWIDIALAFKNDLENQLKQVAGDWKYVDDKGWCNPTKLIFTYKFSSGEYLQKLGKAPIKNIDSNEFTQNLSMFLSKINILNQLYIHQENLFASNMQHLIKTNSIQKIEGIIQDIKYKTGQDIICYLKYNDKELYDYIWPFYRLNKEIHQKLIGNISEKGTLSYLYEYLYNNYLSKILQGPITKRNKLKPWFLRFFWLLFLSSLLLLNISFYSIKYQQKQTTKPLEITTELGWSRFIPQRGFPHVYHQLKHKK